MTGMLPDQIFKSGW